MMLEATVPAKVNLYLRVMGRRADGYHALDSLVTFVDVGERLRITQSEPGKNRGERLRAETAEAFSLQVEGPFAASVPTDETNLILRAATQLAEQIPDIQGAAFTLKKHIPVAAGLGGGSADAAAAMTLLLKLYNLSLPAPVLRELALSLGADVPVCLASKPAYVSGIGEQVKPVALPPLPIVLVNPGVALATKEVFAHFNGSFSSDAPCDVHALASASNDLEPAAIGLKPVISTVLDTLRSIPGCAFARMSGSGATCFAVFKDEAGQRAARQQLSSLHPEWWVA